MARWTGGGLAESFKGVNVSERMYGVSASCVGVLRFQCGFLHFS